MRTEPKPASELEAGDKVDLTTCPVHHKHPRATSLYGVVESTRSAGDRVAVVYDNFGVAEYINDQVLAVCVPWTPELAAEVEARKAAEPDLVIEDRYEVFEGKGVVVDRTTGLMWKRAVEEGEFNFDGAQQHAAAVNAAGGFAGHNDWRVPTIDELKSIVDADRKDPAVHPGAFPGTLSRWFWTSTAYDPDPADAWFVSFSDGDSIANNKTFTFQVRLVRSGQ
jgi:hypothetical protein